MQKRVSGRIIVNMLKNESSDINFDCEVHANKFYQN